MEKIKFVNVKRDIKNSRYIAVFEIPLPDGTIGEYEYKFRLAYLYDELIDRYDPRYERAVREVSSYCEEELRSDTEYNYIW